jgi:hypothetical protein
VFHFLRNWQAISKVSNNISHSPDGNEGDHFSKSLPKVVIIHLFNSKAILNQIILKSPLPQCASLFQGQLMMSEHEGGCSRLSWATPEKTPSIPGWLLFTFS